MLAVKPMPAAETQTSNPGRVLAGKRVAEVVYSTYPADPRPRRAAEALAREGAEVEVICLREDENEPVREKIRGVEVTRVPLKRRRGGKLSYLIQYGSFILMAGWLLACRTLRRRYDLVHVHNMPDILVFSALVPKLTGAGVVLDLHDPMPELMTTIFGLGEKSLVVSFLRFLEKLSLSFADAAITVNEAFRQLFVNRSCSAGKLQVIMNSPDEEIFPFRPAADSAKQTSFATQSAVIMYHGSLVERHGLDLLVEAFAKTREVFPLAQLRIYGESTPFLRQVMAGVEERQLQQWVKYYGAKNLEEISEAIRECDLGVIPNRQSTFTELNMPTRIFEYLSQGKAVIAPRTKGIQDYFKAEERYWFKLGDANDLAIQLQRALADPEEMKRRAIVGQEIYLRHTWGEERRQLIKTLRSVM
jgi:glycosyltransferase involved in cell wall biosynthesis